MKKFLLAAMIGTALSASAVTLDFTYASEDVGFYGISSYPESYDIAIFLPGDKFGGSKITAINVPMYTEAGTKNYSETKVWLTSKLGLEKGENNPNIASYDAELVTYGMFGNLGLTLPEEYTIPSGGVYVGYSFTVNAIDNGTQYPVALSDGSDLNSCFIHSSLSLTSWTNVNYSDGLSSALTVTIVADNLPESNVSIVSVPDMALSEFGKPINIPVTLSTSSGVPVTSLDFEYTFAGTPGTYHYDLPSPVPASLLQSFDAYVELPAHSEKLSEKVEIKVSKVNGNLNESTKNTAVVSVGVASSFPVRRSLIEEATCVKCGYCTRGYAALEYLKKNYPDYICISYHNTYQGSDPMNMGTPPFSISGNPGAAINRVVQGIDPYYGTQSYMYDYELPIIGDILAQDAVPTPWEISVSHDWDGDNLTAYTTVKNILGYENETYKVGYALVADSLRNTASSWRQTNYYNTESPVYIPELNNFCKGGIYGKSQVSGLVFNDVVISVDGSTGVANSIPSSLAAYEEATHSLTWDISKIKSALVPERHNLRIVAFVLNSKGQVLNATKLDLSEFGDTSAVENLEVDNEDAPVEYYNLNGIKVSNPQGGIFIRRQGSRTSKVLIK